MYSVSISDLHHFWDQCPPAECLTRCPKVLRLAVSIINAMCWDTQNASTLILPYSFLCFMFLVCVREKPAADRPVGDEWVVPGVAVGGHQPQHQIPFFGVLHQEALAVPFWTKLWCVVVEVGHTQPDGGEVLGGLESKQCLCLIGFTLVGATWSHLSWSTNQRDWCCQLFLHVHMRVRVRRVYNMQCIFRNIAGQYSSW